MISKWKVYFAPSFLRIFKKLDPSFKQEIKDAVAKIIDFYANGVKTEGLGVKHLRNSVWEARAGLKIRVLYTIEHHQLTFVLSGTHDDVQRFLKD